MRRSDLVGSPLRSGPLLDVSMASSSPARPLTRNLAMGVPECRDQKCCYTGIKYQPILSHQDFADTDWSVFRGTAG